MKSLVVYYSRSGITRLLADALVLGLGADREELIDTKDRSGPLGYAIAGKDALLRNTTILEPTKFNVADYDLVIVGTPVWAFTMATPVRTWLAQNGRAIKRAAFFCTQGGSGDKKTFEDMESLCGQPPAAVLTLLEKTVKAKTFAAAVDRFVETLKAT